ncbi:serine protease [Flavobacteriales bacterium 34_180_T64]|nr:serine protease [Flavobacteriales bacterium 34_180_T64]
MKKKILLISLVFFQFFANAQQDAWIYLIDKENVQALIQNPTLILSQRAIDRKNSHGILIDERDVPVNESYIAQLKTQNGIVVMAKSKWFNAVHVRGIETDINSLLNLNFVDHIDFADKSLNARIVLQNNKFEIEEELLDFSYGNTQNQVEMINVDALHLDDYTGEGIVIAVIDAGFTNVNTMEAFDRLRANNDLLNGYDFVDRNADVYAYMGNSHGTKVLSTMAGFVQDNYVGTAPDASYYLFRTEDASSENPVEESYWVEAAERADSLGVNIINTSLGYTTYDNSSYSYTTNDMDGQTAFISRGADIASEKGMLVVSSAGNSGNGTWQIVGAPADAANVLSIGAVDEDGAYASFSSRGSFMQPTQKPDVVAKGANSAVINENNSIVTNNGTSFSSPIIAGGIACLWQALPDATNEEIKQYVRMSATQYETPDFFLGFGIPDLAIAYNIGLSLQEPEVFEFNVFPNPVIDILNVHVPSHIENTSLIIYDILGKAVFRDALTSAINFIDMSSIASGVYIMSFESSEASKTFKLIKS